MSGDGYDTSLAAWRARAASLPRNLWTLQRFGFTPSKLPYRILDRSAPCVLSVSLPKAGTHLLERALCLHPHLYRKMVGTIWPGALQRWGGLAGLLGALAPGQVVLAHLPFESGYADTLVKTRVLFLIRDPRDIVVSQAHFAANRPDHPYHEAFAGAATVADRVRIAIDGHEPSGLLSVKERMDRYEGWLHGPAYVVRFEDLIGPSGGGDSDRQRATVEGIYRYLGVDATERLVARVCDALFSGDSPTFRRGAVDQWRDAFDDELTAHFNEVIGDRLTAYGYAG